MSLKSEFHHMHQFFKNERGKNKIPDGSGIIFDLSLKGKNLNQAE